ncbi:hypothetical protein AB1Y20_002305 [Prymnesium parvum]|uniref:Uncharacterized protein n=1 Tax=Prymnesium parvum TaxID=97485 RepID=A0AB34JAQ0_PRYPA|mmetsp:Transcript_18157/g.45552  ORF Transcript_18157/g.45552 Transcript_18157/m.45552 type:complete len:226 (+) Transcript_18157:23-700(+)
MLAADKLLLQSNVKQRSIELREKELNLFNSNFSAVGTQAAIMAGFTLTSFVEIDLPPSKRWAKAMLHFFVTSSICVNFVCVAMVTFVTVWGSGKALRGQDGSMDYAVDEMNSERSFIFGTFAVGVLATLGCLFSAAWVLMETEIAIIASVLILGTMCMIVSEARRIATRFMLEPDETVSFKELRTVFPSFGMGSRSGSSPSKSSFHSDDPEDYPLLLHTVKDTKA